MQSPHGPVGEMLDTIQALRLDMRLVGLVHRVTMQRAVDLAPHGSSPVTASTTCTLTQGEVIALMSANGTFSCIALLAYFPDFFRRCFRASFSARSRRLSAA